MKLVFLHGLGGGHEAWDAQVEWFRRKGWECDAWDQPGYGGTPAPDPYTLEAVSQALRARIGEGKAVLVGHSMGGLVAQEAYTRFPDKVGGLVLAFTSAAFVTGSQFAQQFVQARLGPLDAGKTMAELAEDVMPLQQGRVADPAGLEKAKRIMAAIPPATYRKAVHLLTTFDRRAELSRIAVKTLLVAGSEDRTVPPGIMKRMADRIPGAQYRLLEGCGHLGPMDQPQAFNEVLEAFLSAFPTPR